MSALSIEAATAAVAAARRDEIAVVTMSALPFWPTRADDYRLVGLMGAAGSIGLGLALGTSGRGVWVVDGDGSLLMQLGILAAVATAAPADLVHIVLANGVYAISGQQPTPGPSSWVQLFEGAGYATARRCETADEIAAALTARCAGPRGIEIVCNGQRPVFPPGGFDIDPAAEAERVRAALADTF
jgi:thiamine pyrophosphate-dependent acetolactate synthase large subunit-like protein